MGPVIGGILTAIDWRLVFLINVPLGVAGTIWGIMRLREPVFLPPQQRFDWVGSVTFSVGLGSLLLAASLVAFPLIKMVYVYALFALALISLTGFYVVERKVKQPMMDFGLFSEKLFTCASIANAINGLARGAVLFVLIFFLQGPYGLDPLWAGIMMAPLRSCIYASRANLRLSVR